MASCPHARDWGSRESGLVGCRDATLQKALCVSLSARESGKKRYRRFCVRGGGNGGKLNTITLITLSR